MLRLVEAASSLISLTNAGASGGRSRCLPRTAAAFMPALTRSLISEDSNSAYGRDNREHGPAHWAGCVNLILNANKSQVIEFFKSCQKVARGTGKSVEFPHKYAIELKITNAAHQCI